MAEALAGMQHAGVVDQQVDAARVAQHQRQVVRQAGARLRLGHVQRQHMQAAGVFAGQRIQRGRLAGVPAGADHMLAAGQQLADEFQADPAVGA